MRHQDANPWQKDVMRGINKTEHSRIVGAPQRETVTKDREKHREDINEQIDKFFADGGKIQQIPSHQCTRPVARIEV